MAKQNINVGTTANDKKGDSLRAAFVKVNANFTELYTALGLAADPNLNLGAFEFNGSVMTTTDSSNMTIGDEGTTINIGGDLVPTVNLNSNLGSPTKQFHSLYVGTGSVYIGDAQLSLEDGKITSNVGFNLTGSIGEVSGVVEWDNVLNKPTIPTSFSSLVNGANTVSLESTGALTLPNGSTIGYGEAGVGVPITTTRGTILLGNLAECAGGESHFHIMKGGQQAIDLFLGDDSNYVKLPDTGGVEIATQNFNQYSWIFGTDGDLTLPVGGDIKDSTGTSVLGGGAGPVQTHLELTNSPFIIQPVVLGSPVSVSTAGDGEGAEVEVVIGAGPVITSVTVTTPGTDYIVGQRYRVQYWEIGGNNDDSHLEFEVATVSSGGLLTVTDVAFTGEAAANTPGTYSNLGIQLRASPGDSIGPGLTLVRSYQRALFNIEAEAQYDTNNNASPLGTEWNSEGWGDLTGFNTRTYTTFYEALNGAVGNNIIGAELVMHDTINDQYYKFSFSNWGGNNGGSYAYTRTLIERDPNYFKKENYATANNVDVIEDDSTLQIGITRGNNQGIYNPFTEEGWDEDVSPDGTEWNTDGWDDLTDVETRTYTTFYNAYDQNVGNNILGSKAVMYVPSIDKYYAIQWLSWTQNNAGGGFSYLRYEIDLDQLNEGVTFADGTVQKTAYIPTNVKLTASGNRRIEEASGYKSVSVTERILRNITTTASRDSDIQLRIWIDSTTTTIDEILNDTTAAGIIDNTTIEFSLDNTTWYTFDNDVASDGNERAYYINTGIPLDYSEGDAVYFRYVGGGAPVVWWDKDDLPGGSSNFRGAVIDYHAYTNDATIIGTIHIVDDDGDEHITHTEVSSGSTNSENDDLWLVTSEGEIKYRRLDLAARTLKIQWTAKVFYGSETYD